MKELKTIGSYAVYNIQQARPEDVWAIIKLAIKKSDKIFMNETIDGIVSDYSTHIPYGNGFVEERFKYSLTKGLKDFLLQKCQGNVFYDFFLEHFNCEFFKAKILIASMNLPLGILIINKEIAGMECQETITIPNDAPITTEISPQQ